MPRLTTIKNRRDFLAAASSGRKIITQTFVLQICKRTGDHPAPSGGRIGFTVTKKMGNAVARNRIKRRLRAAAARANLPTQPDHDYVIISRIKALDCPFETLLNDMRFAFQKLQGKSVA